MKKSILVLFALFTTTFLFAASYDEAIAYNDKIVGEQTKIGEAILAFSSHPNDFSLKQIKTQADASIDTINSMKPLDNNKDFLVAAKALFKFYGNITKNEYKKILDLIQHQKEFSSEILTEKINSLSKSISKKETPLDNNFQTAQKAFAEKHGFKLIKNKLEDKIKSAEEDK